ncbi:Y+L amino acid transporter 2-like [Haemaphysalis longicornis]
MDGNGCHVSARSRSDQFISPAKLSRECREANANTRGKLKRKVGLLSAIAVVITSIIGSGIFVSPSLVYRHAGSVGVDLVIWVCAGLMTIIRALCMAELGALLPASGGEYAYLCAAGDTLGRPGDLVAFMYAWGRILIADPMNSALQGLTFASYILRLVYPDCTPPYLVTSLVAVAFTTLASALNAFSVGVSTKVQNVLVVIKLTMLVSIIFTGIVAASTGTNNLEGPYFSSEVSPGGLAVAYFAALMTMDGGTAICYLGEEIKNPSQTIPRALIIGVVVVNVLFLLTNVAYFIVLEPSTIAASDATALKFGIESWGTAGAVIIPVVASIATFGTLSSGFFSNSRLGFAAARKGHLPSVLSFISAKSSVPIISLLLRTVMAVAFTLVGSVGPVVNSMAMLSIFFTLFTMGGLVRLRFTMKDAARTIRVPYTLVFLNFTVSLAMIAMNVAQGADFVLLTVLGSVLGTGMVVYVVFHIWKLALPLSSTTTAFVQKLFFCEPSQKSEFQVMRPRISYKTQRPSVATVGLTTAPVSPNDKTRQRPGCVGTHF